MTDTTTHASAAPATPDSTPAEWHTVDADNRWPGRWTAHTASVHAHGRTYLIRITPGDHATYLAPGFYADIDGGYGQHWAINTRTLERPSAARSRTSCDEPADRHARRRRGQRRQGPAHPQRDGLRTDRHRAPAARRTPLDPETARAHLDVALSSVATALDALHAEHPHRTTEREQS